MPVGIITALRAQEHDTQRVNVFIDGAFAIGVSLNTLAREALFVGKAIDEPAWSALERAEQHDKTLRAAMRYLDARPRASAELRDKLRRKEFPPEAIDAALARLATLGLVDDASFARFWVENRQIAHPKGARALRDELRRKGVGRDVIDATMGDAELIGDDADKVWAIARTAMRKYADSADKQTFKRRLGGYLQRRGFGFDVMRPVLDTLWAELHNEDDQRGDMEEFGSPVE
ncbi:MAG: RecX family transcriptional regulator [Chloroflexales bacterium]|nr:RecX family transcriptional regulator [Chloroflexales bacterium]